MITAFFAAMTAFAAGTGLGLRLRTDAMQRKQEIEDRIVERRRQEDAEDHEKRIREEASRQRAELQANSMCAQSEHAWGAWSARPPVLQNLCYTWRFCTKCGLLERSQMIDLGWTPPEHKESGDDS